MSSIMVLASFAGYLTSAQRVILGELHFLLLSDWSAEDHKTSPGLRVHRPETVRGDPLCFLSELIWPCFAAHASSRFLASKSSTK
jgi:hypothetical protein